MRLAVAIASAGAEIWLVTARRKRGSYRVDTFEKLALPGDTGEPVTAGKPDMSELFYRLTTDDDVEGCHVRMIRCRRKWSRNSTMD